MNLLTGASLLALARSIYYLIGNRLPVIVRSSQHSIKKNFNMNPRLSGYISILGLVLYVLKSLLGIARQRSREKLAIFVRMLDIERSY